jgi:hypothetical protein
MEADAHTWYSRRQFFGHCLLSLGSVALASLLGEEKARGEAVEVRRPHFRPRARRVIFLFMGGGPSQFELFDDKPLLRRMERQAPPASFIAGQRFAFVNQQATLLAPRYAMARHGASGATVSELMPHLSGIVDELTFVRSMTHEVFNHGPAQLYVNSSGRLPGRPSMGSWILYGLGSECADLPGFIVLQSGLRGANAGRNLYSHGFLSPRYQGVRLNNYQTPILNLDCPPGIDAVRQEQAIRAIADLNGMRQGQRQDETIAARTAAYELAFRMQTSAPDLVDLSGETRRTLQRYGADPQRPSYARNCLLARRLVERGVRFVQLIHTDWDHHGDTGASLERGLPAICRETDRPTAALIADLRQRGLLDDTLVIWAGEFGRTPVGEQRNFTGRDHHPYAFTIWMAGGGLKRGFSYGRTDELGFQVTEDPVTVQDLQATVLHLLGLNHTRLTYRFQGRNFRLTDVSGAAVEDLIA